MPGNPSPPPDPDAPIAALRPDPGPTSGPPRRSVIGLAPLPTAAPERMGEPPHGTAPGPGEAPPAGLPALKPAPALPAPSVFGPGTARGAGLPPRALPADETHRLAPSPFDNAWHELERPPTPSRGDRGDQPGGQPSPMDVLRARMRPSLDRTPTERQQARSLLLTGIALAAMLALIVREACTPEFGHAWSVDAQPIQTPVSETRERQWMVGEGRFTAVAEFEIEGLILHRRRYMMDYLTDWSPLDLGIGWGPMSDADILQHVQFSQSNRFLHFRVDADAPFGTDEINPYAANVHPIPANDDVRAQLLDLEQGQRVVLRGALVNIRTDHGEIQTSQSRTDTGAGACEVLWVESVRVLE